MKLLVTGATGFLGSRTADLLEERGHELVRVARPRGAERAAAARADLVHVDVGDPGARELLEGCDAVLHFAGVPDPARARLDPARAIRENAGATLNLLEGCLERGAGLVYPSTVRAAFDPPPDAYAISKRLGEEVCHLHTARSAVARLTSVFGPGQVAWEGATGAISSFAARALAGDVLTIPGDPYRGRDFVFVDDLVPAFERIASGGFWGQTVTLARGETTPLLEAAQLVVAAAGTGAPIETPTAELPPGENVTYSADPPPPNLGFTCRPLEEGIGLYVDWLTRHPAPQGRSGA